MSKIQWRDLTHKTGLLDGNLDEFPFRRLGIVKEMSFIFSDDRTKPVFRLFVVFEGGFFQNIEISLVEGARLIHASGVGSLDDFLGLVIAVYYDNTTPKGIEIIPMFVRNGDAYELRGS
jgi:hypothetical protein